MLQITTNNHKREIETDPDGTDFVTYRGERYDIGDFMLPDPAGEIAAAGWDGIMADTFFSGIVIKLVDDCGEYVAVVGLAIELG